jgi:DnaK suppressor protein
MRKIVRPRVGGVKKVSINVTEFRLVLEAKHGELLADVADRDEILIENAAEEFDRLQQQLNREVAIRKLDQQSKLLKSVEAALSRIDDETYGVCLRCEKEIPEKRLKAVPWAGYCVACQEELDRQQTAGEVENDNHNTELAA